MADSGHAELKRTLGMTAITVYAVGDILGAGIYALVGKVAGSAGSSAWLSFVVAALLASLTGLTYAELVGRYPVAAGAAAYCKRAFRLPWLAFVVGILVLVSGITSAAAVSHAFVGYLDTFVVLPGFAASLGLLALMTLISFLGIEESARVNFVLTAAEFSGLVLVLVVGIAFASGQPGEVVAERVTPDLDLGGILAGVTVAFFAYIGFEDTVNVAEEVKDVQRVLPRAILIAIAVTSVLYLGVVLVALMAVPPDRLGQSDAPLLEVLDAAGVQVPGGAFSLIALLAITNTGLLNLIMASRMGYGMAREGLLPGVLARVHPERRTPWVAVLAAFVLAAALALSGGTRVLAQTTSLLLLLVFTLLHVALLVVKRRERGHPHDGFVTPFWTPILGALLCGAMTLQYPTEVYLRAAAVLAGALVLYLVQRRLPGRPPGVPRG